MPTARHADESSSSARATSAAAHELDACALAIGQSHSAWMMPRPPAASLVELAASVDEIRGVPHGANASARSVGRC